MLEPRKFGIFLTYYLHIGLDLDLSLNIQQSRKANRRQTIIKELQPILSVTNGVITYQEQVMKIAEIIAGYSLRGRHIKKGNGKKKLDVMEAEIRFIEGGIKNGYNKKM